MNKQISALLAASLITGLIALAMAVTGANALFNKNGVDPSPTTLATSNTNANPQQIEQLQNRINEYAQREQQYQQMLQNDQSQLQQASDEMKQVQQLLFALQSRGLIRIQGNGTITIPGGSGN
jgi:peptidoglycan hydrolase CwlO-like protein